MNIRFFVLAVLVASLFFCGGCGKKSATLEPSGEHVIEGVVTRVEFPADNNMTVVYFKDGRLESFHGHVYTTFYLGDVNVIHHDGDDAYAYSARVIQHVRLSDRLENGEMRACACFG